MKIEQLKPNVIVRGPIFPEPVQVIVSIPMGSSVKLVGKGLVTGQVHEPILDASQVATLEATPEKAPFDGDPQKFRLGIEALRLGLAYEYDPYFALSTVSPAQNGQGSPFGSPNPGQTIKLRLPASSSPKGIILTRRQRR